MTALIQFTALFSLLSLCAGCTFNHALTQTQSVLTDLQLISKPDVNGARNWVLPRNSHWLVAVSASAPDIESDYEMSRSLAAALRQEFALVSLTAERVNIEGALRNARSNGADLMVYPKYLYRGNGAYSVEEWQDADSDQSFGRDRIGVQLVIYDVRNAKIIDSVRVTNKQSWLPSIHSKPEVMFDEGFEEFAQRYAYTQAELPT